tara:strand:+ start:1118 stop:2020 length:903 start_codon:yes stop_codon:yes gene_type:complete
MLKNTHQLKKYTFKYLIIGSNGLLGSTIQKILPKNETFLIARNNSDYNLDFKKLNRVEKIFEKFSFRYVINCVAITNLNKCEKNKKNAWLINTLLPEKLSKLSQKKNFKYIHISTDHMFSSKKIKYFKENTKYKNINYYSKTKIMAEKKIKNNKKNLIIRTNFTGFKMKNPKSTFIGWIMFNIKKKNKISLFNDMYTSTLDVKTFSKVLIKLIKTDARGIYNVASNGCLNKKDFALKFSKLINKKLIFVEKSLRENKQKRGFCMCLNVRKVEKKLGFKMISINKAINNLSKEKIYEYTRD